MSSIQGIGLVSGGLDSLLAVYVLREQGVPVEAMHVTLPMHSARLRQAVERSIVPLGVPLHVVSLEQEFFEILRHPRYGYGSEVNPCIDCHLLLLRRAAERMQEVGASFVFTGEVLGERPMSQHRQALDLVERRAGLQGRLLRPLSARRLAETIPEQEGIVDRSRLLDIEGRWRRRQLDLVEKYGIDEYATPDGGCILTVPDSARRVRDLLKNQPDFAPNDFQLLKVGRHFRLGPRTRLVVGRDERDNSRIVELAQPGDLLFEVLACGSPVTLLRGEIDGEAMHLAAAVTARYSDAQGPQVLVNYGNAGELGQAMLVERAPQELIEQLRV